MANIKDIAAGTIAGLNPIPNLGYIINAYFVNDELMNIMEFAPIGSALGGNLAVSYTMYDEENGVEASFRGIGEEYTPADATPVNKTLYLKILGGSFRSDRAVQRTMANGAFDTWKEQQVAQKSNQIKNKFAETFINGSSALNAKSYDGIYTGLFNVYTEQEDQTALVLSTGLTTTNCITVEQKFNDAMAKMNVTPNYVITTRSGAALAKTLNAYRNMFTGVVEVGGLKYNQLMGIPVIAVNDAYFPAAKRAIGIPFIFVNIANDDMGIKCGIPMDGNLIDYIPPEQGDGTRVKEGSLEFITVPIFSNPKSAACCYINISPVAVTSVAFTAETLAIDVSDTSQLSWLVAPVNATNKDVTFVSSDPTKATVSTTGLVTGIAVGTSTITITTEDGSFTDTIAVTVSA